MSGHESTYWDEEDVEIYISFDFQEYEPPIMRGDGSYPGCDAEITINQVVIRDCEIDIIDRLNAKQLKPIEQAAWEYLANLPENLAH